MAATRAPIDCRAGVVESRGKVWATGLELYFNIPDWQPNLLVRAAVGPDIVGIDKCWNAAGSARRSPH